MTRPPERFLARLRKLNRPFTSDEVEALFPALRPSSVGVYLSHAVKAGLIQQVGFKRFAPTVRPSSSVALPPFASQVLTRVRVQLLPAAFEQLVVWTNETLAPFTHDAFVEQFLVIEGPKAVLRSIHDILEIDFAVVLSRSLAELGRKLWARNEPGRGVRVYLVANARLDGTRPSSMGFQIPTLGRVLVSVLYMPALLPDAAVEIAGRSEFDLHEAVSCAPTKAAAARLGALLVWIRDRYPNHPVRDRVNEFLHGMLGETR